MVNSQQGSARTQQRSGKRQGQAGYGKATLPSTSQLSKTKLCAYHVQGICMYGKSCNYAHDEKEMQSRPDLKKTKLCIQFKEGICTTVDCPFAHGYEELRSTEMCFKKSPCMWFSKGMCRNGENCRFAHGDHELQKNTLGKDDATIASTPAAAPPPPPQKPKQEPNKKPGAVKPTNLKKSANNNKSKENQQQQQQPHFEPMFVVPPAVLVGPQPPGIPVPVDQLPSPFLMDSGPAAATNAAAALAALHPAYRPPPGLFPEAPEPATSLSDMIAAAAAAQAAGYPVDPGAAAAYYYPSINPVTGEFMPAPMIFNPEYNPINTEYAPVQQQPDPAPPGLGKSYKNQLWNQVKKVTSTEDAKESGSEGRASSNSKESSTRVGSSGASPPRGPSSVSPPSSSGGHPPSDSSGCVEDYGSTEEERNPQSGSGGSNGSGAGGNNPSAKLSRSKKTRSKTSNSSPNTTATMKTEDPSSLKSTSKTAKTEQEREEDIAQHVILNSAPVAWESVLGLEEAKRVLMESVILPARNPEIFKGLRAPPTGVLLSGPAGNGKALLVRAAATAASQSLNFMELSASALISKCYGEPEKSVPALFRLAKKRAPSMVFIDDVDMLLRVPLMDTEEQNEKNAAKNEKKTRRLKTEILLQLDSLWASQEEAGSAGVMVLAATSRPQDLDKDALRRFSEQVYCPAPDAKTRLALLQQLLCGKGAGAPAHNLEEKELLAASEKMKDFSLQDVAQVCREAAMGPVRDIDSSSLSSLSAMDLRPIKISDVEAALVTASTTEK